VKRFEYESNNKLFFEKRRTFKGKTKPDIQVMLTNITKIPERNAFIVDMLNRLRKQENRKILVLSARLEHLKVLKEALDVVINADVESGILVKDEVRTSFYIGGMKEYRLNDAAEADVIFGTYEMAQEGLDIDGLNTLFMATPKKNIIQSIGRIMRKPLEEGDISPLILDMSDRLSMFTNWSSIRDRYYTKNNYTIKQFKVFNDQCVDLRGYLVAKKVIDVNAPQTTNLVKEYICHTASKEQYEFDIAMGNINADEYKFENNIETILATEAVKENDDKGYNVELW